MFWTFLGGITSLDWNYCIIPWVVICIIGVKLKPYPTIVRSQFTPIIEAVIFLGRRMFDFVTGACHEICDRIVENIPVVNTQ